MPTITLTVKYVNPPKPGKTRGTIKDTDDQIFGVFPDKMHLFEPGKTYEIEYSQKESGGVVYSTVTSAKPLASNAPRTIPINNGGSEYNRQTNPVDGKRMFVCANLTAFIKAGKVDLDPRALADATNMLKRLWDYSFGNEDSPLRQVPQNNIETVRTTNGNGRPAYTRQ